MQVWRRQMVGVQDKSVAASCGGLRARPEKHVVASYDLQKMINNLRPDDDISNHIYRISGRVYSLFTSRDRDRGGRLGF